jgi:short-subunit dehydrogenase
MPISERVCIISGATGGLGKVVTQHYADAGARLVLLGRDVSKLDAFVTESDMDPGQVLTQAVDLSNSETLEAVRLATLEKFGRIDILVNLIGGWIGGMSVLDAATSEIEEMLNQHLFASHALIKAFVPSMLAGRWGRVLAISSPFAKRPSKDLSPYVIGKAAMEGLVLSLAKELRGTGVTANLLLVKNIDIKREKISAPSKKNLSWTTPEEITESLLYMSSDEARTVNGARIPLYGNQ